MNGSTAFHLKQIMSAEHLSVTQAAKQIGISPVSMRKVLKDAKMSTAVMFKINRFIDEHESIIATKPGELPTATKPAEPAKKTVPAKATAKKATPAKRNHKELAEKAAAKKTAAKQSAKKVAEKPAKKTASAKTSAKAATPEAKPSAAKQTSAKQNAAKRPAAKQTAKKVAAKSPANQPVAKNQSAKAPTKANAKQQPAKVAKKVASKPAAKSQTTNKTAEQPVKNQPKQAAQSKPAKVVRKQKPARFTIHQIDGAPIQTEAEHEAERLAQAAAVEARAEQLSQAGVGSMNPAAQVPAHRKAQTPAVQKPKAAAPKAQAKPEKPAVAEKPVTPKAAPAKPAAQPKPQAKAAEPKVASTKPAVQPEPAKPVASVKPEPKPETIKPETPAKAEGSTQTTPVEAETKAAELKKNPQTLQLFIDESFVHGNDYQRNMFIGATLVDQDNEHALDQFSNTLYPFGWQPGDEVKARGKSHEQIAAMLTQAHGDQAQNFVTYSPQSDMGNFALGFGIWYPYLATILRVLNTLDYLPNKVRIALDRRNEFEDEQLAVAARMLNAYVKAQSGKDVMFMLRTSDSKSTIGIQYSDFSAHAALTFTKEQLAECGITRLEDLGSQIGDQITLFSMIGLQKYMLDDRSVVKQQAGFKNPVLVAAERLFRLANKATSLSQVPDETLTQAKLVVNQLLQVCPSAISGAINKMPFQTWYDMVARAAALLHYNDETLPNFELDPDAMQIAQDALNNIANLLATAR